MAGFNYRYCRAALPTGVSVKTTTLPRQGNSSVKLTAFGRSFYFRVVAASSLQIQIELQPQTISFLSN
jgi:hypothetical protein